MTPTSSQSMVVQVQPALHRLLVVANPRAFATLPSEWWPDAVNALRCNATFCGDVETRGDGGNVDRIARSIEQTEPGIVVAAGGDGTVREVVQAIMQARTPPALAIIPLGTGNSVARSFGLRSWRKHGRAAIDIAVGAALHGIERRIDLGQVDGRYFIGSFAVGMDGDILGLRNRYHDKVRPRAPQGYPLYLWSCAVNLLRRHGGAVQLCVDGTAFTTRIYNVLVTNTPIYAGEFRFDAAAHADDGCLDLLEFNGAADYVRRYSFAWVRHLRHGRGHTVAPARQLQRVRAVDIELEVPVPGQLDGEELEAARRYRVRVVPQALRVRVPPVATGHAAGV